MSAVPVDWSQWTVILLKPDCLARGLVRPVLEWVGRQVEVADLRIVYPTERQVLAHYDDMLPLSDQLGVDVPAELRRIYVGQPTGIALGYGTEAALRLRAIIGNTDPAVAAADTIRGRFGDDDLRRARERGQLINNLIHSSDTTDVVARDYRIWYGRHHIHPLHPPSTREVRDDQQP